MARHGRFLAQTLLVRLTLPFTSPLSHACTVFGIRTLCSQAPPPSTAPCVQSESDGKRGDKRERNSSVEAGVGAIEDRSRKVAVFWDLDNKPPQHVPPYDAAVRLIEMAAGFGEVVDVAAYANRYAFAYLPLWVKEQRRERRQLDRLERAGIIKVRLGCLCSRWCEL